VDCEKPFEIVQVKLRLPW